MVTLVDTSGFPVGLDIDYEGVDEVAAIQALTVEAHAFANSFRWLPPIEKLKLAFGVGPILGLFLMRFAPGGKPEDRERWVVVGDLPSMHFETDDTPTPALALRLYCAIAQDWAENVLEGRDLSDSYPVDATPTAEHARMLLDRIEFIRTELIPLAH
ncbi:DUF4826 family protein [Phenylobacterium aquaticum]|uniref:DUF4826 family protein n=1 Tax=Phenylobacterium aquaticum TaxID=1763816 RepID=UPI0026E949B1|nr:DUF4826 family protein [Phenylobacterium aquaticum]